MVKEMKKIGLLIFASVLALTGCTKYSATEGLLEQLQGEHPEVSISYLYDGVIAFTPTHPQAGMVFYQGCYVDYVSYAPLMAALAERGYLCLLVRTPGDMALMGTTYAHRLRRQYGELARFYVGGHSLGGVAAATSLASHLDDFDGLVLLGSYSSADLSGSGKRVVSVYGSLDSVMQRDKYEANLAHLPADYRELVIEGGNHSGFGSYGHQEGDGEATITPEEQIRQTVEFIADNL